MILLLSCIPIIFLYERSTRMMKFEFPHLTGQYTVGSTELHIIDDTRKEPNNPTSQRELMVSVWYPTEISDKKASAPYFKDDIEAVKTSLKKKGFPEKDISSIDTVYTHAIPNAAPLHQHMAFPVILFSHGYLGAEPSMYTAFCEELASQGYIVASIAHTYYATVVKFPDGRCISPSAEKYEQQTEPTKAEQELWIADIQCVLDYLTDYNADPTALFFNLLDMNRVGIVGHSMGGSAAFQLCIQDSRVKAGISLDGFPFGENVNVYDLKKPFMFILAQNSIDNLYLSNEELAEKAGMDLKLIEHMRKNFEKIDEESRKNYEAIKQSKAITMTTIPGIQHGGFSDFLILKELPLYKNNKKFFDLETITGNVDGITTLKFINKLMVNFFNKQLTIKKARNI